MILDKLRPYLPVPPLERGHVVRNEQNLLVGGLEEDTAWGILKGKDQHSNRMDVIHQGEIQVSVAGKYPAKEGEPVMVDQYGQIYGTAPTVEEVIERVEMLEEATAEAALAIVATDEALTAHVASYDETKTLLLDQDQKLTDHVNEVTFQAGAMFGSMEERITALENSTPGEGGDVDLGPLTARVKANEDEIVEIKKAAVALGDDVAAIDNRLHIVETAPDGAAVTAGSIVALINNELGNVDASVVDGKIQLDATVSGGGDYVLPETVVHEDELATTLRPVTNRLDSAETAITALQNKPDSNPVPTKWYVLPLAGQSNMTGFGEIMPNLPKPNPRLMQLGIHASGEEEKVEMVTPTNTGYGDKFDIYRPYADCNLKLIPTAPCLDSFHNLFYLINAVTDAEDHRRAGGLVGVGHYLAQAMLQYIPEDYGILIVNVSRGSTGFGDENDLGTYNAETMSPDLAQGSGQSGGSRRWWGDGSDHNAPAPYGLALYDRIKHALELNPENVLLPVIWFQGESDDNEVDHYERFKNLVRYVKGKIVEDGLEGHLPTKSIKDFRWMCFGSTKILLKTDSDMDYYKESIDYTHSWSYLRAMYDNYAYLMDDPEFQNPHTGESQIVSVRADLAQDGKFFESAREELEARGFTSVASSTPDWHWSTATLMFRQPSLIMNALSAYGKCFNAPMPSKHTRMIHSKTGLVTTDNVVFDYDHAPAPDFIPDNLLANPAEPQLGQYLLLSHDFSVDHTTNTPSLVMPGITVEATTPTYVDDAVYGKVLSCSSSSKFAYSIPTELAGSMSDASFSLLFKADDSQRTASNKPCVVSFDANGTPIITINNGAIMVYARYGEADSENLALNKSYQGAWKGQWNDWQHITIAWYEAGKLLNVYLNGCHVDSIKTAAIIADVSEMFLGNYRDGGSNFSGQIAKVRMYGKCLTPQENYSIYLQDVK